MFIRITGISEITHSLLFLAEASNNVTDDPTDSSSEELNQICARLCSLIKAQLVKSHDEVMARYGGQAANFTVDDLTQSPGEEDLDLTELMTKLNTHSNATAHSELKILKNPFLKVQNQLF